MAFPRPSEPDEELVAEIRGLLAGAPETDPRSRVYSDLTCPECGGPLHVHHGDRAETYDWPTRLGDAATTCPPGSSRRLPTKPSGPPTLSGQP